MATVWHRTPTPSADLFTDARPIIAGAYRSRCPLPHARTDGDC